MAQDGWIYDSEKKARSYDANSALQINMLKDLLDMLPLKEGDKVLDIGCGPGGSTVEIGKRVGLTGHVLGIDPAADRIKVALEKQTEHPNLAFEVHSAEEVDKLEFKSYDSAIFAASIHYIRDHDHVLQLTASVTRIGGHIGITTITGPQLIYMKFREEALKKHGVSPEISEIVTNRIDRKDIEKLLTNAGYGQVKVNDITTPLVTETASEMIETIDVGRSGSFLGGIPEDKLEPVRREIEEKLEGLRRDGKLEIEFNVMNVIAVKEPNKVPISTLISAAGT